MRSVELGAARLGVRAHRPELDDVERPAVEADASLAEEDRARRRRAGSPTAIAEQQRAEQRRARAPTTTRSTSRLIAERERPVRAGHEREDRRPVELLDRADGDRAVEDVHRDPDDLALLLAELRDRVDQVPLRERQADRDLVDDPLVEDVLEVVEGAEVAASRPGRSNASESSRKPTTRAELAVVLELGGERLAARAGAEDEDEAQVLALPALPLEASRRTTRAATVAAAWIGNRTSRNSAADVRQLEDEQDAEREQAP